MNYENLKQKNKQRRRSDKNSRQSSIYGEAAEELKKMLSNSKRLSENLKVPFKDSDDEEEES